MESSIGIALPRCRSTALYSSSPRNRSTSSSVRKAGALDPPPSCLGGGPHGWVPVDTHSTPVPSSTGEAVGGLSNFTSPMNHSNTRNSHMVAEHEFRTTTQRPISQPAQLSKTIGTGHGCCRADTQTDSCTAVEQVTTSQQGSQEMLENATLVAPFGKEDTAAELQSHAARTQNTLVNAVENVEVTEIKRAVIRALTRLRATETKEFDTIARLEKQVINETF